VVAAAARVLRARGAAAGTRVIARVIATALVLAMWLAAVTVLGAVASRVRERGARR
jgi:hypothetical protein